MRRFIFNKDRIEKVIEWLNSADISKNAPNNNETTYSFYIEGDSVYYLSADTQPPQNKKVYCVNQEQLNALLSEIGPKATHIKIDENIQTEIAKNIGTLFNPADLERFNQATQKTIQKLNNEDIRKLVEALNIDCPDTKTAGIASLMDATWMLQTVSTNAGLVSQSSKAARLASTQNPAGILFNLATGLLMGIGCGLAAASIYEKHAISQYNNKIDNDITYKDYTVEEKNQLKTEFKAKAARDARLLGLTIFGSMTGWTLGAGIMQGAFYLARTLSSFTPHGLLINIGISVAAGFADAIVSCLTTYKAEKAKFTAEEWQERKKTPQVRAMMIKTFVTSFVSGFAWNMIDACLPKPIQTAVKHVGGQILSVLTTTIASGLTTLAIMQAATLANKLRNSTLGMAIARTIKPQSYKNGGLCPAIFKTSRARTDSNDSKNELSSDRSFLQNPFPSGS